MAYKITITISVDENDEEDENEESGWPDHVTVKAFKIDGVA